MEFATEIGQNLLVEVRRLQALLTERDRALEKCGEEKERWEAERDGLIAAMRSAEGGVGEYPNITRVSVLRPLRTLQGGELEPRGQPPRTPFRSCRRPEPAHKDQR